MIDPYDLLKAYLKERVILYLKTGEEFEGILEGFDEHLNLLLTTPETLLFLRGENVIYVGQNK
ncbi:hypothetical protein NUSPORA_01248 [Nucleospora cyclopteri]